MAFYRFANQSEVDALFAPGPGLLTQDAPREDIVGPIHRAGGAVGSPRAARPQHSWVLDLDRGLPGGAGALPNWLCRRLRPLRSDSYRDYVDLGPFEFTSPPEATGSRRPRSRRRPTSPRLRGSRRYERIYSLHIPRKLPAPAGAANAASKSRRAGASDRHRTASAGSRCSAGRARRPRRTTD